MQRAKPGNSSARFSPASKPANDAAEGYQIDVLRVTTLHILAGAQMRMSGPLHFFWSSGVTWRSRARHVGRGLEHRRWAPKERGHSVPRVR